MDSNGASEEEPQDRGLKHCVAATLKSFSVIHRGSSSADSATSRTKKRKDYNDASQPQHEQPPWKRSCGNQYTLKANQEGLASAYDALAAARQHKLETQNKLNEARNQLERTIKGRYQRQQQQQQPIDETPQATSSKTKKKNSDALDRADLLDSGQWAGQWMKMYNKMKEYRRVKGGCLVPMEQLKTKKQLLAQEKQGRGSSITVIDPDMKKLCRWVKHQREYYKKFQNKGENNVSQINQRRIDLLDELGFCWNEKEYQWQQHYQELARYKQEHGTCRVAHDDDKSALFRWAEKQYAGLQRFRAGRPNAMTDERVAALERLGFQADYYGAGSSTGSRKRQNRKPKDNADQEWQAMYDKLAAFARENGHCEINRKGSSRIKNKKRLVGWVAFQKKQYKLLMEGKPSRLTLERARLLDGLGLLKEKDQAVQAAKVALQAAEKANQDANEGILDAHTALKQVELQAPLQWNIMYQQLVEYKAMHGDCLVPMSLLKSKKENQNGDDSEDNKLRKLARWVKHQREYYNKYTRFGEDANKINPRRIDALEEIGFVWNEVQHKWNERYKELVSYKEQYGNCKVPTKYEPNQPLALWVDKQRIEYRKLQAGKPNTLVPARLDALNRIGFEWSKNGIVGSSTNNKTTPRRKNALVPSEDPHAEWMAMYEKLFYFYKIHGHVEVGRRCITDQNALRTWCAWQRKQYDKMVSGEPSQMTQERVRLLQQIGFKWRRQATKKPDPII